MENTMVETLSDYEIERGKPMPSLNHSIIQANLIFELQFHYRQQYRIASEISLRLEGWPSTPDIGIFPKMKVDFRRDKIQITEPPLGVIEIVSPSQSVQDQYNKAVQYFEAGVRSVWLIIPPIQAIVVYASPDSYETFDAGMLTDKVLNISISVDKVFEMEEEAV